MDKNRESLFSKEFLEYLTQLVMTWIHWLITVPQANVLKLCKTKVWPQLEPYLKDEALPYALRKAAQNGAETESEGAEGLERSWEEMINSRTEKALSEVKLMLYKLGSEQAIWLACQVALRELRKRNNKNTERFAGTLKLIPFPKLNTNQRVLLALWLMHNVVYRATVAVYCSWPKDLSIKRRDELLDDIAERPMSQAARNQKTSRAVKMFKDYFLWLEPPKLDKFPACLLPILSGQDEVDCESTNPAIYTNTIDVALSWLRSQKGTKEKRGVK